MKSDMMGGGLERGLILSLERGKKMWVLAATGGAILLGGCGFPGSDSDSSDRPPEATEQPQKPEGGKDKKADKRAKAEAKRKARAKAAKEAKAKKQAQARAQRAAQAAQTATTEQTPPAKPPKPPKPTLFAKITPTNFVYAGVILPAEVKCDPHPNSIVGCTTQTVEDIQQFGAAYAGIIDRTFDELNSALPDEAKPVEARFVEVRQGATSKECPGFDVGNQRYCLKKEGKVGIGTAIIRHVYKQSVENGGDEALAVRAAKIGVSMFLRAQRTSSSREFNYCLAGAVTANLLHEKRQPKTDKEKARAAEKQQRVMGTIEEIAQNQVDKSGDNAAGAKEAWVGAFVDAYTDRVPYVSCATHDPEAAKTILRGA